jgi:hypothetical protein
MLFKRGLFNLTEGQELHLSSNKVLKKRLRFYQLHTAEQQNPSWEAKSIGLSKNSPSLKEPECSVSCSQKSASVLCTEPNKFNLHPPIQCNIHFETILPSKSSSSSFLLSDLSIKTLHAKISGPNYNKVTGHFTLHATDFELWTQGCTLGIFQGVVSICIFSVLTTVNRAYSFRSLNPLCNVSVKHDNINYLFV